MKKYIAEALGTGLLAFTVTSTAGDPFAIAAILAIAIYAYAGISGAHFNLSVTTAMWSRGEISCQETIKYAIAQILGAILAVMIAKWMLGDPLITVGTIKGFVGPHKVMGEFLAGAILLTAIFVCMRNDIHPAWGVALAHIVLVTIGMKINTSITLASFLHGNALLTVVVFAIAQIIGGIAAGKLDKSLGT